MERQKDLFGQVICEKHHFKIAGKVGDKILYRCINKNCHFEKISGATFKIKNTKNYVHKYS